MTAKLNNRLKIFFKLAILILILLIFPALLSAIENVALNLGVRSFLILLAIYIVLDLLKYLRPTGAEKKKADYSLKKETASEEKTENK